MKISLLLTSLQGDCFSLLQEKLKLLGIYREFSNNKYIEFAPATLLWLNQQLDTSAAINSLIYQELDSNVNCFATEEELEVSREQVITLQQQLDVEQQKRRVCHYRQVEYKEQLEISQEQVRVLQLQIQENQQEIADYSQQVEHVKNTLKNLLAQLEINKSAICTLQLA